MTTPGPDDGVALPGGSCRPHLPPPRILPMPAAGAGHPGTTVSPRQLLEGIVEELLDGHEPGADRPRLTVNLDLGDAPGLDFDPALLRRIVEPLLRRSILAAGSSDGIRARRPEVVVTAVTYPDAVEFEFADSGAGLTPGEWAGLRARDRASTAGPDDSRTTLETISDEARSLGGSLTATNCPEGGSAVTLRLPLLRTARRRAA